MNKTKTFLTFFFLSFFSLLAEEESDRNLNLGWLGYLNLPEKIQKDGKKVKIQTPELWNSWSDEAGKNLNWFAQPKRDYQKKINFYLLLNKSDKVREKKSRRWKHLNK